jgi:hypothetical protein
MVPARNQTVKEPQMASVVFDKLWDDAFRKEGELVTDAAELAEIYKITSAIEAVRMARFLQEAGKPLFEYCEAAYNREQARSLDKARRRYHLSPNDVKFIKQLLKTKTKKDW